MLISRNYEKWPLWRLAILSRYFDIPAILEVLKVKNVQKRLLFWSIPSDLNGMTFGQRITLINAFEKGDIFASTYKQLTKVPTWLVWVLPIGLTYPFVNAVVNDLRARAKRDEALILPLTPEQQAAGIGQTNHGWFGLIDAIVQRMHGRYAHEDVENLPDNRVFRMLLIDVDRAKDQRRMMETYNKKR